MNYYEWEQIRNHYYLGARNTGPSRSLKGDVVVIHLLINDMASNWMYPMHVMEYQNACNMMAQTLMREAARSGTSLLVRSVFCQVNLPTVLDPQNAAYSIPYLLASLGHPNVASMQSLYERTYSCDETPIVIALNRPMRSFASVTNDRSYMRMDEFSVIFRHTTGLFDPTVMVHELLHQFGAADYYYPDVTVHAAERYCPSSIMYRGGPEIDDLTRYLVGWTDDLTPTALAFLRDTAYVNDAMIMEARMRGV